MIVVLGGGLVVLPGGGGPVGEIAVRVYGTVVRARRPEYAVLDGGTTTFYMDIVPETPPYYYPG